LAIIVTFLSGCEMFKPDDEHYYLSDSAKTDLKIGDTLIYKSNTDKIAKYKVHDVANGNIWVSLSKKDGIDNPPFAYYEAQVIYIDTVDNNETNNYYHYSENFSVPTVGTMGVFFNSYFISIGVTAESQVGSMLNCNWYNKSTSACLYTNSYTILTRQFSDVFYRDTDSTLFLSQGKFVKTFYCNIKQGLLGFKYSDGETYELAN